MGGSGGPDAGVRLVGVHRSVEVETGEALGSLERERRKEELIQGFLFLYIFFILIAVTTSRNWFTVSVPDLCRENHLGEPRRSRDFVLCIEWRNSFLHFDPPL